LPEKTTFELISLEGDIMDNDIKKFNGKSYLSLTEASN